MSCPQQFSPSGSTLSKPSACTIHMSEPNQFLSIRSLNNFYITFVPLATSSYITFYHSACYALSAYKLYYNSIQFFSLLRCETLGLRPLQTMEIFFVDKVFHFQFFPSHTLANSFGRQQYINHWCRIILHKILIKYNSL